MPDYASILRRSISALPDSSPEMREAVYQRARAALARQLTAVDPPLSTRDIEAQHQELEDAVARLEADYASAHPIETDEGAGALEQRRFREAAPAAPPARSAPPPMMKDPADDEPGEDYDEDDEDDFDGDERASRTPLLIGLLLVALVIGG